MQMAYLTKLSLALTLLATSVAVAAQTPEPIPQHPISTKPEGASATCTYTGSVTDGGKTSSSKDCPRTDTPTAPTAQRFPFPGETSSPVQAVPGTTPTSAPAAQKFPFPTEKETAPGLADAGSSGDSSSSSSSSSGPDPTAGPLGEDDDPAAKAAAERKAARHKLPKGERLSPGEREEEDLRVAGFYQADGNFRAAYLRATDAVSLAADDPDAHFALAEAARKLLKLDEAKQHYQECLKLDPVPKEKKAAEKALKEMAGGTS